MYVKNNDNYYYLTLMNENYHHPERPKNLKDSEIMQGAYLFKSEKSRCSITSIWAEHYVLQ